MQKWPGLFLKPFQVSFNYLFTSSFVFAVVLPLLLWILKLACKWVSLRHIHTHVILSSFLSLGFALPASLAEPLPCPYSPLLTFISYVFIILLWSPSPFFKATSSSGPLLSCSVCVAERRGHVGCTLYCSPPIFNFSFILDIFVGAYNEIWSHIVPQHAILPAPCPFVLWDFFPSITH